MEALQGNNFERKKHTYIYNCFINLDSDDHFIYSSIIQAKETPEPDFDLSECVLTQIPSGIFVLCKVLRKEILNLSHNKIVELHSGGSIGDLVLLRVLDLSFNHIKRLPDDVSYMENLRVSEIHIFI